MRSSDVDVVGLETLEGGCEGEGGCEVERRLAEVLGRRDEKREWSGREGAAVGMDVEGEEGRDVVVVGVSLGLDFRRRSSSS